MGIFNFSNFTSPGVIDYEIFNVCSTQNRSTSPGQKKLYRNIHSGLFFVNLLSVLHKKKHS